MRDAWKTVELSQLRQTYTGHSPAELIAVDLKDKAVILPAKMGWFRNSRELQFGTCRLWQNYRQV